MMHKAERRTATTKTVRELEAESVAFVVGKAIGLITGTASADYIQLYQGNASLLAESLEVIQQTANVILAALEPHIAEEVEGSKTELELAEVAA
jgi:DNA integrity scanning protein DisA with diadenylate cyclase activity